MTLLVVKHDQIRPQLHGWICGLLVNKEPATQNTTTHPTAGNHQCPLAFYLHGLRHRPTGE